MRIAILFLIAAGSIPFVDTRADEPSISWEFTAHTQAAATAAVRARVTGYLTQAEVQDGDTVAKGDLLAEIDSRQYKIALDRARAKLQLAKAKLDSAKITSANVEKLFDKKVLSAQEVALEQAGLAEAEAAVLAAQAEVEQAELTLSWTRVTAPFDGTVTRTLVAEGELVNADQTQILTLVSAKPLRISFNVPESILLELRRGGSAQADKFKLSVAFAGEVGHPHTAALDLIEPEVDPRSGSVLFRGTVANDDGLLSPGMSANIRLTHDVK